MGQLQISARFAFILSVAFRTQTHTYARTHAHTHTHAYPVRGCKLNERP